MFSKSIGVGFSLLLTIASKISQSLKADELLFERVRGALFGVGRSKYGGILTVRESEGCKARFIYPMSVTCGPRPKGETMDALMAQSD